MGCYINASMYHNTWEVNTCIDINFSISIHFVFNIIGIHSCVLHNFWLVLCGQTAFLWWFMHSQKRKRWSGHVRLNKDAIVYKLLIFCQSYDIITMHQCIVIFLWQCVNSFKCFIIPSLLKAFCCKYIRFFTI